jgi:hypothetical protein
MTGESTPAGLANHAEDTFDLASAGFPGPVGVLVFDTYPLMMGVLSLPIADGVEAGR